VFRHEGSERKGRFADGVAAINPDLSSLKSLTLTVTCYLPPTPMLSIRLLRSARLLPERNFREITRSNRQQVTRGRTVDALGGVVERTE